MVGGFSKMTRLSLGLVLLLCGGVAGQAPAPAPAPKPPPPPKPPNPAKLQRQLMEILACIPPGLSGGLIGFDVLQLNTGRTLAQYSPQNQFTPASNMKLYSTATALARLGPDYRYETRVAAATGPDQEGRLAGDLYFIGSGDASLASRYFPLSGGAPRGMRDIEALADQVARAGVKRIDGAVIGDDTAYPHDPYPMAWTVDDTIYDYGAPVSALTIHDNVLTIHMTAPQDAGALVRLAIDPPIEYFTIDNHVVTGHDSAVHVDRQPGSRLLRLTGTLAAGANYNRVVAIDNPARYAAMALADALERRGISIRGGVTSRSRTADEAPDPVPTPVTLASHTSVALEDILLVTDKVSQNLFAELIVREVGRKVSGTGTRQSGINEIYKLLWEAGVRTECCYFQDGSGLSRQTLVSPLSTVGLLEYMYRSQWRDTFLKFLPIGGFDGSLRRHFKERPDSKKIRAKTGAIAHVASMSGYVESKTWGPIAFSAIINTYNSESAEAWGLLDKIAVALLE